jgi:hypothetical protein
MVERISARRAGSIRPTGSASPASMVVIFAALTTDAMGRPAEAKSAIAWSPG